MRICERCGGSGQVITTGPFAGSSEMSYCYHCSMNLCDSCMAAGHCSESETGKHLDASTVEDEL